MFDSPCDVDVVRCSGDRGSTSLAAALLAPLFVVLLFAAFQAALWGHARTETRVAAAHSAAQVARVDASPAAAEASIRTRLADRPLDDVAVAIDEGAELVVVTVTATAPGILVGTSRPIRVTVAVPVERIVE